MTMILDAAMGKVESCDVHAFVDKMANHLCGPTGGADGADDLGPTKRAGQGMLFEGMGSGSRRHRSFGYIATRPPSGAICRAGGLLGEDDKAARWDVYGWATDGAAADLIRHGHCWQSGDGLGRVGVGWTSHQLRIALLIRAPLVTDERTC